MLSSPFPLSLPLSALQDAFLRELFLLKHHGRGGFLFTVFRVSGEVKNGAAVRAVQSPLSGSLELDFMNAFAIPCSGRQVLCQHFSKFSPLGLQIEDTNMTRRRSKERVGHLRSD
jgi:hypothetical protein